MYHDESRQVAAHNYEVACTDARVISPLLRTWKRRFPAVFPAWLQSFDRDALSIEIAEAGLPKNYSVNNSKIFIVLEGGNVNYGVCPDRQTCNFALLNCRQRGRAGCSPVDSDRKFDPLNVFVVALLRRALDGSFHVVVVGLPLLFLGMEVWREQQSRFTPST